MTGERAVKAYVAAQATVLALGRMDPADMPDYEYALRQAKLLAMAKYRALNGGQLAEARRRLAQ